jgi:hypothetical protein
MSGTVATEFKPNMDKLRKLQQQASSVVIGGKVRKIKNKQNFKI